MVDTERMAKLAAWNPADQVKVKKYANLTPHHPLWKWRMREAARTAWHFEYGAYYPAVDRSAARYLAMKITPEEEVVVDRLLAWMDDQTARFDRWW